VAAHNNNHGRNEDHPQTDCMRDANKFPPSALSPKLQLGDDAIDTHSVAMYFNNILSLLLLLLLL
jgi:hypothetical protein